MALTQKEEHKSHIDVGEKHGVSKSDWNVEKWRVKRCILPDQPLVFAAHDNFQSAVFNI